MRFTRFPRVEQPTQPSPRRVAPHRDPPLLVNLLTARSPRLSPWHAARTTEQENAVFGMPLAELRRLKLISAGRLPNPWKR